MDKIMERINRVFQIVFENEKLEICEDTTADDIPEWNSLTHINLLAMLEKEFDIRFDIDQIISFEKVGDICKVLEGMRIC